ncbi:MAG: PspC family transcriptional regulator [Microscillaceae bacterium]|nr:PspC family transcriptional regulator [Microscillaceae bacterium]
MKKLQAFMERQAFGVCTKLGEKIGIATSEIRLFFIYTSFLTLGSPLLIYLSLAFLMNIRKQLRRRNNPYIWDI